ncbi:GNAT family N-acetyltransferase [Sphingomonas cannabina]|uniref:GNAT family N-acetyltransferase n=1 Tax=Sphingomonas cannabina TaxID=2899123 RepID=UPI001F1FD22E|nr:GNAT family N-acetyltransferase [Sphingomonas cannabina]UIJ43965.1 GNAT family N-acetyltransferase [Sphingomonas cannabina]
MSSDLMIRLATRGDLPGLHPVIERAYRGDSAREGWTHEADLLEDPRTSLDVLEGIIASPEQRLLVAERGDGTLLGCVSVTGLGGGLAYLGQLCVEPRLQAGGIGKLLLTAAEDCARSEFGADRIEMTVIDTRAELIAYYERRGYALTGERRDFPIPLDPPMFMVVLEKPLA